MARDGPRSRSVTLSGEPPAAELAAALESASLALDGGCEVLRCRVAGLDANLRALEALALLGLLARRGGGRVRLVGASRPLLELVRLAGLDEALGAPMPPAGGAGRRGGRSSPS